MDSRILTFIEAAKTLSFSKTAKKRCMSQPNVSIQIRQLEDEVGHRLFDRYSHHVQLTPYGQVFYSYAVKVKSLEDDMKRQMKALSLRIDD